MPEFELKPGVKLFYREDDLTDMWAPKETLLALHGFAESSLAWNGWMPQLARRFRVIRPDMRGFGLSTPMPADYQWSVDEILNDYMRLMDHLEVERFHLLGAKIGGGLSLKLAATHPKRVITATTTGARVLSRGTPMGGRSKDVRNQLERDGVEAWARSTMGNRLGSSAPEGMAEGWIQLMARTPLSTMLGFMDTVPSLDVRDDLAHIVCPTLIIKSQDGRNASAGATGGQVSDEEARAAQELIPTSSLIALPGDSWHIAATHAEVCAKAMLEFIDRVSVPA